VNQSSPDQFLALLTAELDEGVLIIRDGAVWFCNPAAKAILSAAGADLPGRARPDLVQPAPPRPVPGQQIDFVGHEKTPKGAGPLVRGLAVAWMNPANSGCSDRSTACASWGPWPRACCIT